jgi:hypothetical protein
MSASANRTRPAARFSKQRRVAALQNSLFVCHSPDGAVAVFTEQQRAVFRDSNPDWPTPDKKIARHETGNEIFVFAEHFAGRVIKGTRTIL